MQTTQRNFRFPNDVYTELQATAKTSNCTITDLIVAGARKELIWRKIRDEIGMPETLIVFDKERGTYQGDDEYRKGFLKKFVDAVERKIPVL